RFRQSWSQNLLLLCNTGYNNRYRSPLIFRDIGVDIGFAILWMISGLTIIFPVYHGITSCNNTGQSARILGCQAYFASIFCCWTTSILYAITSLLSWRLSLEHKFRGANTPRTPRTPRTFIV
ncbi:4680_t:CDS:2, partial [Dentiscutata heterogama]